MTLYMPVQIYAFFHVVIQLSRFNTWGLINTWENKCYKDHINFFFWGGWGGNLRIKIRKKKKDPNKKTN